MVYVLVGILSPAFGKVLDTLDSLLRTYEINE